MICNPQFPYSEGWLGADSAYSVQLDDTHNLWLFGESFIAITADNSSRAQTTKINNSVAVSSCDTSNGNFSITYQWTGKGTANPKPFFPTGSSDTSIRFRPMDGFVANGATYVLLHKGQVISPNDPFGFTRLGVSIAKITGTDAASLSTTIQDLPVAVDAFPGVAAAVKDGYVYLFASTAYGAAGSVPPTILTRIPLTSLDSANGALQYFAKDGTWKTGLTTSDAQPMFAPGAGELSVRFHEDTGQWVAVYNDPREFSRNVLMRTAAAVTGPWSDPQVIFQYPELDPAASGFDPQTFCRSAVEHPEFDNGAGTVLTYSCSSVSPDKVAANMDLYYKIKTATYTTPITISTGSGPVTGVSLEGIEKPTPERGFHLNMGTSLSLSLARNETTGRVFSVSTTSCQNVSVSGLPSGVHVSLFHMPEMTTTRPSYKGGISGTHYDPLVPLENTSGQICANEYFMWADISVDASVSPGSYSFSIGGIPVSLKVRNFTIPQLPARPFYIGAGAFPLLAGHKLSPDTGVDVEGPLAAAYRDMLRAHRLEPQGLGIQEPPLNGDGTLNFDNFSQYGGSYRQIVMNGALGPVCVESPAKVELPWVSQQELQGWQTELSLEPALANAWIYLTDEPFPYEISGLVTRAQFVRQYAPGLKTMVTTEPVDSLVGLIDHFAVIFDSFNQPGHWQNYAATPNYFLYTSCIAHGSCVNDAPGNLTGTPDVMIDESSVNGRAYALIAYKLGADAAIYYNSTQAYGVTDPWVDQYEFGGNGDGTLFYPGVAGTMGFTQNVPVASIRLKAMRQGQYDLEYLKMAQNAGITTTLSTLVPDQFHWSRNNVDYDNMREQIGNALSP